MKSVSALISLALVAVWIQHTPVEAVACTGAGDDATCEADTTGTICCPTSTGGTWACTAAAASDCSGVTCGADTDDCRGDFTCCDAADTLTCTDTSATAGNACPCDGTANDCFSGELCCGDVCVTEDTDCTAHACYADADFCGGDNWKCCNDMCTDTATENDGTVGNCPAPPTCDAIDSTDCGDGKVCCPDGDGGWECTLSTTCLGSACGENDDCGDDLECCKTAAGPGICTLDTLACVCTDATKDDVCWSGNCGDDYFCKNNAQQMAQSLAVLALGVISAIYFH